MANSSSHGPHVVELFSAAQGSRSVLQDFTPLADSVEWAVGARYFAHRGSLAFLCEHVPVPYTINNTGALSRQAANLLFAALTAESELASREHIVVLELGIGLGLFARYFLDAFQERCASEGTDFYTRLTYVAADYSDRMLLDAVRRGTFEKHPGRYLLRTIDALDPVATVLGDPVIGHEGGRPFAAVFLNYVLDCLPASVLRWAPSCSEAGIPPSSDESSDSLRQLCVRTCLARGVNLSEYTEEAPEDLARLATSRDPADRNRLLGLFGLFATEYEYRPVCPEDLPFGSFAASFARAHAASIIFNHGAITSLQRLLSLLRPDGFILINDYGTVTGSSSEGVEHQRYGNGSFIGLNFALLKHFFSSTGLDTTPQGQLRADSLSPAGPVWLEPAEESGSLYSRLLGHDLHPVLVESFHRQFDKAVSSNYEDLLQKGRELAGQGRIEAAAAAYRDAVGSQPWNWLLLQEVARFVTFGLLDAATGLEIARAGIELNPCCSPELWNAYGEANAGLGRLGAAQHAFERAIGVSPDDVPARLNMALVLFRLKQHSAALQVIAEGLARDWRGEYRDRLLHTQTEVLADQTRRARQEFQAFINRINFSARSSPRGIEGSIQPPVADKRMILSGRSENGSVTSTGLIYPFTQSG